VVWSSCSLNLVEDKYDLHSLVMSDPPQVLTLACCLPADMSHTLDFEGSPATAAHITVHTPTLRGSGAGACSMSATHDTVTFRVDQQQFEVRHAPRESAQFTSLCIRSAVFLAQLKCDEFEDSVTARRYPQPGICWWWHELLLTARAGETSLQH
jgi:hypothetical protein